MPLTLGALIPILFALIVLGVLIYGAVVIIRMIPMPEPIRTLAYLIVAVVALIALGRAFGIA